MLTGKMPHFVSLLLNLSVCQETNRQGRMLLRRGE